MDSNHFADIPDHQDVPPPEFCPNPACHFHDPKFAAQHRWYNTKGWFFTKARGYIPRFVCKNCTKSCSTQTFSIHYWTHRTEDMRLIDNRTYGCSGCRQICRDLNMSYRVLKNRQQRLARNYLNCFNAVHNNLTLNEDAAFDGFESFVISQFFPVNYHILAGSESQFPYMVNVEIMNRKGRMTAEQKHLVSLIKCHWSAREKGIRKSCKELFTLIPPLVKSYTPESPWNLFTDEKKDYVYAMKEIPEFAQGLMDKRIIHTQINSKEPRTILNPLFPVNYLDREIRKNLAGHVRETLRHDREINMAMVRIVMMLGHHGFFKTHRIRDKVDSSGEPSHGDVAGITTDPRVQWALGRMYSHRHVWSHQNSRVSWMKRVWKKWYTNPPLIHFGKMEQMIREKKVALEEQEKLKTSQSAGEQKEKPEAKTPEDFMETGEKKPVQEDEPVVRLGQSEITFSKTELKNCLCKRQPGAGWMPEHLVA